MTDRPLFLIVGCGYLGARVGEALVSRGARVVATTRSPDRLPALAALGLDPEVLDLERPDASGVWTKSYNGVVYSVAPGRGGDARVAFRDGPLECARRARGAGSPPRFVLVSSTGVYSEDVGGWVDEESPAEPAEERLRWLRESEEGLRGLASRGAIHAAILRLGGIYGPERSPFTWLRRPEMRASVARGHRDGYMNWVRVEDAAEAVAAALEASRAGEVYNVVDGEPVRRADFYGFSAELAGLEPPTLGDSGGLGKRIHGAKARRDLGFVPRFPSYREGLADLFARASAPP